MSTTTGTWPDPLGPPEQASDAELWRRADDVTARLDGARHLARLHTALARLPGPTRRSSPPTPA